MCVEMLIANEEIVRLAELAGLERHVETRLVRYLFVERSVLLSFSVDPGCRSVASAIDLSRVPNGMAMCMIRRESGCRVGRKERCRTGLKGMDRCGVIWR